MANTAVIYWSQPGNTEAMARAIAEGADADLFSVSEVSSEQALTYGRLALGCPAMGAEVLEEEEFEPFFSALESKLCGKKVALFGSYGWGDGQWMRNWQERVTASGASLYREAGLTVNDAPGDGDLAACREFGAEFSRF